MVRSSLTQQQCEHLDAAQRDYARLLLKRDDPSVLIPKIRANLKRAGVDASVFVGEDGSAKEIEHMFDRKLFEVAIAKESRGKVTPRSR